ncbi:amidohydrolase [Oleiharenicola lentus]|uniref:Amidohydrolase n=1 Tax=Oleiharenicola lentus TaxID=2508720 RepID=A0A4Q1C4X1_9BACT|nr:amidohydrolase family protein [Oleiharenicola lentus]RXK53478.1 amidohydrolase [Oleiharenicola lentus]
MNKPLLTLLAGVFLAGASFGAEPEFDRLLLKNYHPVSLYRIQQTLVRRAAVPVIDMHSHSFFVQNDAEIRRWVQLMDEANIERTIVLTGESGPAFDALVARFAPFKNRFELWCGFDYTGIEEPGYGPAAAAELERCMRMGARGVGEESDKGLGLVRAIPGRPLPKPVHPADPRLDPLWEKCAELGLPVNLHVADPIWMYHPLDEKNEGIPNAAIWKIGSEPERIDLNGMIGQLEETLRRHPRTTIIACHLANLDYDLTRLDGLLARYPNLYADLAGRLAETAAIPRTAAAFIEKHRDRLFYGTDMELTPEMYQMTFRILETTDEHFYGVDQFCYVWNLSGFGLRRETLEKLYRTNALELMHRLQPANYPAPPAKP